MPSFRRTYWKLRITRAFPDSAFRAAGGMESAIRRSLREFSQSEGSEIANGPAYPNGNRSRVYAGQLFALPTLRVVPKGKPVKTGCNTGLPVRPRTRRKTAGLSALRERPLKRPARASTARIEPQAQARGQHTEPRPPTSLCIHRSLHRRIVRGRGRLLRTHRRDKPQHRYRTSYRHNRHWSGTVTTDCPERCSFGCGLSPVH